MRFIALVAGGIVAGLIVHFALFQVLARFEKRGRGLVPIDDLVIRHTRGPLRMLFPLIGVYVVYPLATPALGGGTVAVASHVLYVLLVLSVTWLFIRLSRVLHDAIVRQYSIETTDNLMARKMQTQVGIMRRILVFSILFVGVSAILLRFEGFRQLGTGLLASAGIVGIVVGFAAQRTLGNVLAGIQIAVSQPIRVDDVVVVEGEWGRIEEITLTYVVVRIWDERRLVLPISYFIEQPFQNWTRTTSEILGTVFLHLDYTVPFEAVRQELQRLLEASEYWDGKVWRLHVTDATERTVQVRALMSAVDSSSAWELRCEVREKLIEFIQRDYPGALPTVRGSIETTTPAGGRTSRDDRIGG